MNPGRQASRSIIWPFRTELASHLAVFPPVLILTATQQGWYFLSDGMRKEIDSGRWSVNSLNIYKASSKHDETFSGKRLIYVTKAEPPIGFAQWGLAWKQLTACGLSIPGCCHPSWMRPPGPGGSAALMEKRSPFRSPWRAQCVTCFFWRSWVTHINIPSAFLALSRSSCHRAPDLREP